MFILTQFEGMHWIHLRHLNIHCMGAIFKSRSQIKF